MILPTIRERREHEGEGKESRSSTYDSITKNSSYKTHDIVVVMCFMGGRDPEEINRRVGDERSPIKRTIASRYNQLIK